MQRTAEAEEALSAYDRLLSSIGERSRLIGESRLASHWPHVGLNYRGLVIAGQALQGWDQQVTGARWFARQATTVEGRERILDTTRTWFASEPDSVGVIATLSNRRGSPFWSLCRDLVARLEPDGEGPWYSRFAWANVYPVGPDDPPGSPGGPLKEAQDAHVAPLLAATLTALAATRVVVISGPHYWSHPAQSPIFAGLPAAAFPLIRAGKAQGTPIVVGYHPTYVRRRRIGAGAYADQLVQAMRAVEAVG